MKAKVILLMFTATVISAPAAVTLNTQFGTAFDSSGVAVANGTLWALVVDVGSNGFTGFGANSSLASQPALTADAFFTAGQSLAVGGNLNGNTIFRMGGFNGAGPGITDGPVGITYGVNGTAAGLNYAFYWFPGATFTGGSSETIGSQVGGINTTSNDGIFDFGMVLPPDGALASTGAATAEGGGSLADSSFQAVNLIPEPSAALLGAIGALGLLRRRRI